jgi:coenzyme F420-reducing hydrogenase alpha subunit
MSVKINERTKKALQNKAKKANAPYSALKQIYDKGVGAAVGSGRRPGVSVSQWAMARVNSVLTGGKARSVDSKQWEAIQKFRKAKKAKK